LDKPAATLDSAGLAPGAAIVFQNENPKYRNQLGHLWQECGTMGKDMKSLVFLMSYI
jgi:hypothetical protein